MKNIIPFALAFSLGCISLSVKAQQIFTTYGYSPVTDLTVFSADPNSEEQFDSFNEEESMTSLSYFSLDFGLRYNVYEVDESSAVSVGFYPRIAYSQFNNDQSLYGTISAPVYAEYNIGLGSTFDDVSDHGFSFGLGLHMSKVGVINLNDDNYSYVPRMSFGFMAIPSFKLDYRSWVKGGAVLFEYSLRGSYGGVNATENVEMNNNSSGTEFQETKGKVQAFNISLTFRRYLNI